MLQRIQSFYLVLVIVGVVLMFQFPIAVYTSHSDSGDTNAELQLLNKKTVYTEDGQNVVFVGDDSTNMKMKWVLPILAILFGVIALVSIFLFKNRVLQMRVVAFAFLFNVVYIFLIYFWAINGTGGNGGYLSALASTRLMGPEIETKMLTPGTIAPIVTAVLLFLAQRAIRKDELKVRAADRLR